MVLSHFIHSHLHLATMVTTSLTHPSLPLPHTSSIYITSFPIYLSNPTHTSLWLEWVGLLEYIVPCYMTTSSRAPFPVETSCYICFHRRSNCECINIIYVGGYILFFVHLLFQLLIYFVVYFVIEAWHKKNCIKPYANREVSYVLRQSKKKNVVVVDKEWYLDKCLIFFFFFPWKHKLFVLIRSTSLRHF